MGKQKVSYYYDNRLDNLSYGVAHPMKISRIKMTHQLVMAYDLHEQMNLYRPSLPELKEFNSFHTSDYIEFLSTATPNSCNEYSVARDLDRFNIDQDCPVFDGLWAYCQVSCGGSLGGAYQLNTGIADICVNWAGGLHHAKKSEASGFCYVNDIVIGIQELLKRFQRVLYIDIDIHHGDGVEEAFYTTPRVLTMSFHQHGHYFPGTGAIDDIGVKSGKGYSINFPLDEGLTDANFEYIFKPVIQKTMENYRPGVIVLQCGADSLSGDRLGLWNMSLRGHGKCVEFCKSLGVPLMILGGGGYTPRNVARCWAYETSLCCETELSDTIPYNEFFNDYGPEFKLHFNIDKQLVNKNTQSELDSKLEELYELIDKLPYAPSVQMKEMKPLSKPPEITQSREDAREFFSQRKEAKRIEQEKQQKLSSL